MDLREAGFGDGDWIGFVWLKIGTSGGLLRALQGTSGFHVKGREFLDCVSVLVDEDFAPWRQFTVSRVASRRTSGHFAVAVPRFALLISRCY